MSKTPPIPPTPVRKPSEPTFHEYMVKAQGVKIDIDHLDGISDYLSIIATALGKETQFHAKEAHELLKTGPAVGVDGKNVDGAEKPSALGWKITEAHEIDRRADHVYDAVQHSLKDLETALRETSKAITQIAHRYKTSEQRRRLAAADVTKMLPH